MYDILLHCSDTPSYDKGTGLGDLHIKELFIYLVFSLSVSLSIHPELSNNKEPKALLLLAKISDTYSGIGVKLHNSRHLKKIVNNSGVQSFNFNLPLHT
jgi:hypothetical protein